MVGIDSSGLLRGDAESGRARTERDGATTTLGTPLAAGAPCKRGGKAHGCVPTEFVEKLIDKLLLGGHKDWAETFRQLVESLGGRGGEIGVIGPSTFEDATANPQILISFGEYQKTSDRDDVIKFFYDFWRQRGSAKCTEAVEGDDPAIACCALPYSKNEVLGIVIWGGPRERFADLTLLRVFGRLLAYVCGKENESAQSAQLENGGAGKFPEGYVEGYSDLMVSLHRELALLSRADFPILILGETGVGKEYIAQILHRWSSRRDGPFVPVNCAAIPGELMEAEMFGIGRGVASGVAEREGYFQLADGGTLFLDEVGELPLSLQAKLLRALQEKEVRRVGGTTVRPDVRVIAATNADLRRRIEAGTFRSDLYYRIAGFELNVPPLRQRKGDLSLFIEHFLRQFSEAAGKRVKGLTLKALELLNEYHWPGNVRELAHEIRRLVYLCPEGHAIGTELLSPRILAPKLDETTEADAAAAPSRLSLEAAIERLEQEMIAEALRKTRGNRTQAAKLLGITRNGLAIKMERLGLKS